MASLRGKGPRSRYHSSSESQQKGPAMTESRKPHENTSNEATVHNPKAHQVEKVNPQTGNSNT